MNLAKLDLALFMRLMEEVIMNQDVIEKESKLKFALLNINHI